MVIPYACLDIIFKVLPISELAKIGVTKPIFLDFESGGRREGSCLRGHGLLSLYSSYTKFTGKNSIFFVSNSNLCRAMLPNYLRTLSSALCQIRALERRHLRSKTMSKVYPKSWFWTHAFDWPEQTLKIYMQYSTYFACNNDLCRAVLTNLLGDIFLSFLQHLSLEEGIWEE